MTLEQYRIFKTVVDAGGVNAAAKLLHKTQPAVSNAITRLETELDLKLFDRSGYRLTLSDQGAALYSQILLVLDHADKLKSMARHMSRGDEPEIRIGMEVLAPVSLISGLLTRYGKDYPATRFRLSSEVMGGAIERLEEGAVDIVFGPKIVDRPQLTSQFVTKVLLVPVAAPGFAAALPGVPKDKSLMANFTQIVMQETTRQPTGREFATHGGPRRLIAPNFSIKKHLILDGVGWGFMPHHFVDRALNEGALVQIDIHDMPAHNVSIHAFRNGAIPAGPIAHRMWRDLQTVAAERRNSP